MTRQELVDAIRNSGLPYREIAAISGVSIASISRFLNQPRYRMHRLQEQALINVLRQRQTQQQPTPPQDIAA